MENLIVLHCSALKVHFITFEGFWLLEHLHLLLSFSFSLLGVIQIELSKKFLFEMWKFSSVVGVLSLPPCGPSLCLEESPVYGEHGRQHLELPPSQIHLIALEKYSQLHTEIQDISSILPACSL